VKGLENFVGGQQKTVGIMRFSSYYCCNSVLCQKCSELLSQRERLHAMGLSICLSVCLSVSRLSPKCKNNFLKNTKQYRAVVSIDNLLEVVHGLFKEPISGPIKSKMVEIRHLGSCIGLFGICFYYVYYYF